MPPSKYAGQPIRVLPERTPHLRFLEASATERDNRGRNLPTLNFSAIACHQHHHQDRAADPVWMAMTAPLGKKPTACVPCHERKVRCDSTTVGFPCTRCTTKDRADSCIMLERGGKNSNKRRRTATDGDDLLSPRQGEEDISVEQQTPVSNTFPSVSVPFRTGLLC
jgi:hypothetical protein